MNRSNSCNFAKAANEPQKVTAPIRPAKAVAMIGWPYAAGRCDAACSSAPATSNDAAPPNPFNNATIWGMAVIGTRKARTAPIPPPMTSAAMIQTVPQ